MIQPFFTCLLLLACCSGLHSDDAGQAPRPITESDTVFAIYASDSGLASGRGPKLIFAAWSDGHLVWSEDRIHGGAPYRAAQIEPRKLTAVLSGLERDGLFADKSLSNPNFGPDSRFTTILLKSGKKQLKMDSWHEGSEATGGLVATSSGLEPLTGRRRLDVLRKQPARYLYYRLVWSELRVKAAELIPSQSKPVDGKVLMREGIMTWQEGSAGGGQAEQPASAKEQELTPEGAKQALLEMMRAKPGKDLGWFNGNVPDEMAKMRTKEEKDGWYAWTGAFRFNPSRAIYNFVVRPRPGVQACIFEYEGSFVRNGGRWSATPPKLVGTALQTGR